MVTNYLNFYSAPHKYLQNTDRGQNVDHKLYMYSNRIREYLIIGQGVNSGFLYKSVQYEATWWKQTQTTRVVNLYTLIYSVEVTHMIKLFSYALPSLSSTTKRFVDAANLSVMFRLPVLPDLRMYCLRSKVSST